MIKVEVKPRQDNKFDIYVTENGEPLMNSSQGYENVEDAERVARRLFQPVVAGSTVPTSVVMIITFRDGLSHTERIR